MRKDHIHTFSFLDKDNKKDDDKLTVVGQVSNVLSTWTKRSFQKKNFLRKLPILTWLPEYNASKLLADVIAGLTLGMTTIPQVLGVANVAQLPPEYGLYSAFIGCFIYIFLGSTKYITVGPTVTTAIVTLSYTRGMPPQFSVLLCFLTGVATLLMSFLQLGFIVEFISKPVISGFTSAAAISIASTQAKALLGLSFDANGFVEEVSGIVENISDVRWQDTVVAIISLSTLYILMKIEVIGKSLFGDLGPKMKKVLWILSTSRSVTVVLTATVIFGLIGDPSPVIVVGDVPKGLPEIKPPPFSYSETIVNGTTIEFSLGYALREKTTALIVIPLIALMEHITITKAFSGTNRIDATQELFCLGVTNIVSSFFSSMPVTGAFGRTALNHASGAQSPLGGLLTGCIIILALVVLTPQFYYIPKSSLSSVVVMAVIFMVDYEILKSIWKSKRFDLIPWIVTFLVSLLIGLEYGIISGFAVSVLYLLYYASRPGVKVSRGGIGGSGFKFLWVEMDRSMTFPSIEYTRYTVMKAASKWGQDIPILLDCQFVSFADFTSAQGVTDILKLFKEKNQPIILWKVKPSVRKVWDVVLTKSGLSPIFCSTETELELEATLINWKSELKKDTYGISKDAFIKLDDDDDENNNNEEKLKDNNNE